MQLQWLTLFDITKISSSKTQCRKIYKKGKCKWWQKIRSLVHAMYKQQRTWSDCIFGRSGEGFGWKGVKKIKCIVVVEPYDQVHTIWDSIKNMYLLYVRLKSLATSITLGKWKSESKRTFGTIKCQNRERDKCQKWIAKVLPWFWVEKKLINPFLFKVN